MPLTGSDKVPFLHRLHKIAPYIAGVVPIALLKTKLYAILQRNMPVPTIRLVEA